MNIRSLVAVLWLVLLAGPASGKDAPGWLRAIARDSVVPAGVGSAPAVVLLDETTLEIDETGQALEIHRFVLKILHNSGSERAVGLCHYNGASSKVLELKAWLLRQGEAVEEKGRYDWLDTASNSPGAAIDESRSSRIDLSGQAVTGDVMGYETRVRTPLVVAQLYWDFGGSLPQVMNRLNVTVPPGFTLSPEAYGAMQPVLSRAGDRTWSWILSDQPYVPDELAAPDSVRINAELLIQIHAPATATKFRMPGFASWSDVTTLYDKLNQGQCDTDAALADKAQELTAGKVLPLDIIRQIAVYVQKTRYVGIYRGLRYGYGWRARKATEVFATDFGDCKDKANLMVAMLREKGITAYPAIARLDRDRLVRASFPSPIQFNHAIVAIQVPDEIDLPAVRPVDGLGRVLFFDPTDPYTQVGDLSLSLQGGQVHVVAPAVGGLVRLPELPARDGFRQQRRLRLELAADGTLRLQGRIGGTGQAAAELRRRIEQAHQPQDQEKLAIRQLAGGLKTALITDVKTEDDRTSGACSLSFGCVQRNYLQHTTGATAVLKLDVLSRQHLPNLTDQQRQLPVDLLPLAVVDEIELKLPPGFAVDEVPRRAAIESSYGSFLVEYENRADALVLRRELVFNRQQVPVAEYQKLRKFLADIARADRNAVLIRKNP